MNINIENPEFLLATLKDNVVNRTHFLVSQGIAYDANWRDDFVELFKIIEQVEISIELHNQLGDDPVVVPDLDKKAAAKYLLDNLKPVAPAATEESFNLAEEAGFAVGDQVTKGKYGRIEWTILEIQGEKARLGATLENGAKRLAISTLDLLNKVVK